MRYLFINEGSRGHLYNSEIGREKDFHQMLAEFVLLKYEKPEEELIEVNEVMKLRFGGESDLECFCEVIFDKEYNWKVYILNDKNEIESEKYKVVNYVNDESYDIININNLN